MTVFSLLFGVDGLRLMLIAKDAQALVQPNGRLFYGDQTNTAMRFATNTFDFTFNAEQSFTHGGSASLIAHTDVEWAPTRDESMIGMLKVDGQLMVIKGTGGSDVNTDFVLQWTNSGTTGAQTCNSGTQADCTRAFDIAYETFGGRAMVVYADTTAQKLYYCYWNGTAWAPVSNCAPTNGSNDLTLGNNGRPFTVVLKANPLNDNLSMGVSVDVAGVHWVEMFDWTGATSTWDSGEIVTNLGATGVGLESGQNFDFAFESLSGKGELVVADSGGSGSTNQWTHSISSTTWDLYFVDPPDPTSVGANGTVLNLALASDPVSNRIAYTYSDDADDSAMGVWKADGSTSVWTMGNEDTVLEVQDLGTTYADVIWQNTGSVAMWVAHTGTTAVQQEWSTATCTGSGCTFLTIDLNDTPAGADDGTFMRLNAAKSSNDIMQLWGHIDRDLYAQHWSGTAWEAAPTATLEADQSPGTAESTTYHGISADFVYVPYSAWQRNWRFYDDETVNDPTTGLNGAAENASPTGVDLEEFIRLRVNVAELSGFGQTDARKKLQFTSLCNPNTSESTCTWVDVGDTGETSAVWRYATAGETCAGCADGSTSTTSRLTGTNQGSPSVFYVSDKDAAADTDFDHTALLIREIDYPLKAEAVAAGRTYFFRVFDVDKSQPVYREQDTDAANDCASATCTYPSLTVGTSPTLTQNDFEWYVTEGSVTLTDIWPPGSGDNLAENAPFTQMPAMNQPFAAGFSGATGQLRVQMNFTVTGDFPSSEKGFELEYLATEDCTGAGTWATVGFGGSPHWNMFTDATLANPTTEVTQISTSDVEGNNVETNTGLHLNPNSATTGQDVEWDWPIVTGSASTANTTYCFRMVFDGAIVLNAYNSDSYPKLTTAPGTGDLMRHGNFFQNGIESGSFWAN